jgi:hypothetical protein
MRGPNEWTATDTAATGRRGPRFERLGGRVDPKISAPSSKAKQAGERASDAALTLNRRLRVRGHSVVRWASEAAP